MLYVFIWMLHMSQWLYTYVANVCSKCFTCFRRMLQVFYLDVAYAAVVIYICCKHMFQLFRMLQQVRLVSSRALLGQSACVHGERQSGPAPNERRTRHPCTTRRGTHGGPCSRSTHGYACCAPSPLSRIGLSHMVIALALGCVRYALFR
jgi:hypothetical protein